MERKRECVGLNQSIDQSIDRHASQQTGQLYDGRCGSSDIFSGINKTAVTHPRVQSVVYSTTLCALPRLACAWNLSTSFTVPPVGVSSSPENAARVCE